MEWPSAGRSRKGQVPCNHERLRISKVFLNETVVSSQLHDKLRHKLFILEHLNFCLLFRATPADYGGSQARVLIRAVAAGLYHSHSNAGSELCLRPTLQLMATPDP